MLGNRNQTRRGLDWATRDAPVSPWYEQESVLDARSTLVAAGSGIFSMSLRKTVCRWFTGKKLQRKIVEAAPWPSS